MKSNFCKIVVFATCLELLDVIFKYLAITRLSEDGRVSFPIGLGLHKNPGIAFDIEIPLTLIIFLTFIVVILLLCFAKQHYLKNPTISAVAIIVIIGALGNAVDRILNGFTTDYLILFRLSAINFSDILILTGVTFLLWYNESTFKLK